MGVPVGGRWKVTHEEAEGEGVSLDGCTCKDCDKLRGWEAEERFRRYLDECSPEQYANELWLNGPGY